MSFRLRRFVGPFATLALLLALPGANAGAQQSNVVGSPICDGEGVTYNPGNGEDIAVPEGYSVSVFARDLNFPTGIAFRGSADNFQAFVIESGTGLPGRCNNNEGITGMTKTDPGNPFTPDLVVLDMNGHMVGSPMAKPGSANGSFQSDGPAIGLAFENGFGGGRLFATDSNQGVRGAPGTGNNTSRVLEIQPDSGAVTTLIPNLPTGDHPTENIVVNGDFIYWAQGSATNTGVTGHDNGAGGNQQEIPCQNITLSQNLFDSGDGHLSSGYSVHGLSRPGAEVPAFESAANGMHACTGAILRARFRAAPGADMASTVEPFSWGYRNPYGLRFAPNDHLLKGGLFVTENGEDERGARPTNHSPDRLQVAMMNQDGTPDWHGWPDYFGGIASTQAVFDPVGGPADDLTKIVNGKPDFSQVLAKDVPVRRVLAFDPGPRVDPLAIEPSDVADVMPDFAPNSFAHGIVRQGAAFVGREGDFGFSPSNGEPEEGHDVELVNFSTHGGDVVLERVRFAFNCRQGDQRRAPDGTPMCAGSSDQAFEASADSPIRGMNRITNVQFGPDGALYVVDYGAVRDFGQSSGGQPAGGGGGAGYNAAHQEDAPLVQIPHTGTIWRIARTGGNGR